MKNKIFCLRIDLESNKGIKEGLPKILELLKKYKVKASFYLCMGGESNIIELLKYRKKSLENRKITVFSTLEKLRIVFFSTDFVNENIEQIKRIITEGHELGIHGWKHREWTRGLNQIDIKKRIKISKARYKAIFGKDPISFAAPGFITNENIIKILNNEGFKVISDLPGNKVRKIKDTGMINVPITIRANNNVPLIENLVYNGLSDNEIFEVLKREIKKKKLSTLYGHCIFECRNTIDLLDKLFVFLKKEKIKIRRIKDFVK
jgi:peptidoglycan/xylan/chitin deacetylase (PgdA/CDA1 family)